jgi:hypothetical protein|nr:MAG TPA: hypothetical protein [Caudoviricetes sp.]
MTYKLTIEGNTTAELIENIKAAAALYAGTTPDPKAEVVVPITIDGNTIGKSPAKASQTTQKEPVVSTDTASEFDGVKYSLNSTPRNIWILLNDGRVLFVPAGGRLPLDSERAKKITKAEYTQIAEEEPERVVKSISEVIDEQAKTVSKKDEPTEEVDEGEEDEAVAEDLDDDEDDDEEEDEDDEDDLESLIEKAAELVKVAKKLDDGKKTVRDLLDDYDVKRVSKFDDVEEIEDFISDLEEFIEENED